MKGDFTRLTFKKEKHYSSVRMQQGRVQVDADWNEQADITLRRIETEAADLIGGCGGPMHYPGFHLVADTNNLTLEEQKLEGNQYNNPPTLKQGDLYVSAGRYYADGVMAENERIVALSKQPHLPGLEAKDGVLSFGSVLKKAIGKGKIDFDLPEKDVIYQAYLDVWQRHLTALEDEEIREKALGGPDTATRTQTVWQVKLLKADKKTTCFSPLKNLPKSTGLLKAQTTEVSKPPNPCVVPESAGYRGLENQLYRVEIHQGGTVGTATFKWSRENGSVVTRWIDQDPDKLNVLTVETPGRDAVLGFSPGDWVELTDDLRELWGLPGVMVKLANVEGTTLTLAPGITVKREDDFPRNPKVRRWDHQEDPTNPDLELKDGGVVLKEGMWLNLEQGIQVYFEPNEPKRSYHTGDYWLIPARTANADTQSGQIEWPGVKEKNPLFQPPHGIQHHYCPLAVLTWNGTAFTSITDCRKLFPPVTELTSLLYVSGDGQEAMPGHPLPQPLRVRVANGQWPVIGAKVQFTLLNGGGSLSSTPSPPVVTTDVVTTGPDGIAECKEWTLGASGPQQVKAQLLDAASSPIAGQIVYFNANLSIASQVAYTSPDCPTIPNPGIPTVQALLETKFPGWPTSDSLGNTTVKEILDALLCKLDAGKIPYDPMIKLDRWEDIKEGSLGAPPKPNTVQDALDELVQDLESSDITYRPNCGVETGPTVRSLLGVPFDKDSKISEVLNKLLCTFNATRLPIEKNKALCKDLQEDETVETVQDALNVLCKMVGQIGGKVSTGLVIFQNMIRGETRVSYPIDHGFKKVDYVAIIMALEIQGKPTPPLPPLVVMGDLDSSFPESPLMVAHYTPATNVFRIALKDRRRDGDESERTWRVRWWAIPKTQVMKDVIVDSPSPEVVRYPGEFLLAAVAMNPGVKPDDLAKDLRIDLNTIQPELKQLLKEGRIRIGEGRLFSQ